jgi:hypothetical protein
MRVKLRSLLLCTLALTVVPCAAQKGLNKGLVVHEWGTFLTMNGSDGVTLDGMYHEEHALPGFVHARSKDQLRLRAALVKGETPVIYFYTDKAQSVDVKVGFPGGVWTQWYPQANSLGPGQASKLHNGQIGWSVDLQPAKSALPAPTLPKAEADALWNHAREVDAAYVRTANAGRKGGDEWERFIFYRGLGRTEMPLELSAKSGGTVSLSAAGPRGIKHLFVLRVEDGKGAYRYVPSLQPGASLGNLIPSMDKAKPMGEFEEAIGHDLAKRLTESGLYEKEAHAMVNTWRTSYFRQEGIRVLYVLPQAWTDAFIPMQIDPKPAELVRVMVGRTELLTPEREERAAAAVRDLASPKPATREQAFVFLREQGRYVEPVLRRVARTTDNDSVRVLCERLLLTGFVTDLRTAAVSPLDGTPIVEKPAFVRAQLAGLLREIGLHPEAKQEGQAALKLLDGMKNPPIKDSLFRKFIRARARAHEGMGDVKGAINAYATFIKFGSQSRTCGGCHNEEGPRTMAFYRDWWAGRKYAQYVSEAGLLDSTVREHKETLKERPNDTATSMMLAYLYDFRGDEAKASEAFAVAGIPAPRKVAVSARETGAKAEEPGGEVQTRSARSGEESDLPKDTQTKRSRDRGDIPRPRQR